MEPLNKFIGALPAVGAVYYIGVWILIALLRMSYPFELEWMEGGSVEHVARLAGGEGIYVKPTLDFVPYIYPPFYYWVSAAGSILTGVDFFGLRLVSFLSTLAVLGLIGAIVWRETSNPVAALLGAGCYAATFRLSGGWFDVARVDSLFVALMLSGLFVLRFWDTPRAAIVAALLAFLAFFTKQTAVIPLCAAGIVVLCMRPRFGLRFGFMTAALIAVSTLVCDFFSGGWYRYYVFTLPAADPFAPLSVAGIFHHVFTKFTGVMTLTGVAGLIVSPIVRRADPDAELRSFQLDGSIFWLATLVATGVLAWMAMSHEGGASNVYMPAYAILGIVFGVGWGRVNELSLHLIPRYRTVLLALLSLLLFDQFYGLRYNPKAMIPSAEDRAAGEEVITLIESFPGDVLVPYHGYLAERAGKSGDAPGLALHVILVEDKDPVAADFMAEYRARLDAGLYDAVIVNSTWSTDAIQSAIGSNYRLDRNLMGDGLLFYPVSGTGTRPDRLYVRSTVPNGP